MIDKKGHIDLFELDRTFVLSGTLNFTKYMFYQQFKRKFVVNSHHEIICDTVDRILKGELKWVIFNVAPRYSKTELVVKNLIAKGFAKNPASKFIHLSYSDDLALDNSEGVKDIIKLPAYQNLFPEVKIKKGSDSKKKWYTPQGGGMYSTAAGGQVTGFGAGRVDDEDTEEEDIDEMFPDGDLDFAGALIIDDPIKPDDAESETMRNRVNNKFDSTIINRVNSRNTPIIVIMQRLHENDLCGYLMANYPDRWHVVSLPCIITEEGQDLQDGKALWEFKHTLNELLEMNRVNPINFGRQYMQNPQPREGLLYRDFKEYSEVPPSENKTIKSYTDTADTGKDFLCSIAYDETETGIYVTDVLYTDEPMEITEPETARRLAIHGVQQAMIESNNGGRGFARNVESHLVTLKAFNTEVNWFHQGQNKEVRIFTNSAKVNMLVHFPVGWKERWPKFHKHLTSYSAKGKNKHDDAPDTLTGMVEYFGGSTIESDVYDAFF